MTGPLAEMYISLLRSMSAVNETAVMLSDTQRRRILEKLVEARYEELRELTIFDTSRAWCNLLPSISELFPAARLICCLRSPAWIIDSVERYVQSHPFRPATLYQFEASMSVYNRVDVMMAPGGLVAGSLHALRQAWFGEHASRLIGVTYDSLTRRPAEVMSCLYKLLGEEPFDHDFEHLKYDEPEIDALIGAPGFHRVASRVQISQRLPILPPDIFNSYNQCFWTMPDGNPRGVIVL
jgi:sulfotransferase